MLNIPTRQNNPGDLKTGGKIATYNSPIEGKAALYNDLTAKMTGTSSTGLNGNSSLVEFAKTYAPASDNNDPLQYAANLANKLGVSPDTKIGSLTSRIDDFANAVSGNEGYQNSSDAQTNAMLPPPSQTPQSLPQINGFTPPTPPTSSSQTVSDTPSLSPQDAAHYLPLGTRMGTNAAPTAAEGKDTAIGSFKGLISSLPSGGKALDMGRAPGTKLNDAMGVDVDKAFTPTSPEQQAGSLQTQFATGLLTPGTGGARLGGTEFGEALGGSSSEAPGLLGKLLALKRLSSTADTLTTRELESQASRVRPNGKLAPSNTETRAADLLVGKTSRNPVKTLSSVNDEIANRGKEAETYLETNAKPITNKEDFDAFNAIKDSSKKYMTPAEAKAYDEQIGVFQKILKGYGKYDTSNYYKALKEYESQVTANLPKGKDALLVPGGSARIQAAKDVRKIVRDMIGSKNSEFKGKMFDLASLYDVKDTVAGQVADKAKNSVTLAQRHPGLIGAAKWAGGVGATALLGGEVAGHTFKN